MKQNSFYNQVFQQSIIAQVIVDKDLTILDVNKRMFESFHMSPHEVKGLSFGSVFGCGHKYPVSAECGKCKAAKKCSILKIARNILLDQLPNEYAVFQYQRHGKNQHGTKWFHIAGSKVTSDDTSYAALNFVDITEQKQQEVRLKKKLILDQSTGLMNKQSLIAGIDKLINPSVMKSFTLCMIDFDNFKKINDSCGHLAGDKVLETFAEITQKHIRKSDLAGRFGGEEFVLIFMDSNLDQSLQILKRIHNELGEYSSEHIHIPVTFSAGIVYVNAVRNLWERDELFLAADRLLYQAKNKGKSMAMSALGEFTFRAEKPEQTYVI